jgi:signal peptidase
MTAQISNDAQPIEQAQAIGGEAATTANTDPQPPRRRRRPLKAIGSFLSSLVLNVLAVLGVVCIIAVICAFAFNITLIMFKTGSMTPAIPQGSLAVVQEVPASSVGVGDIVTIDRESWQLPITHRIISTQPGPDGTTIIEMKGDANPTPDPTPYQVTTVRKVLWSMPGLAYVIVRVSDPRVMVGITLGAALLVGWAFWPRREDEHPDTSPPPTSESP